MFLYHFKNFIYTALSLCLCLAIAICIKTASVCRLSALSGERTFFLDSASSQGLRKTELTLADLHRVKGECVYFDISAYDGGRYALKEDIAYSIAQKFGAEIQFVEETCGITSYYCYTDGWEDALMLYGKKVNLHIAVSKKKCAVGTPIIFDGF